MIGYIGEETWQRKLPVLYEDIDQHQARDDTICPAGE